MLHGIINVYKEPGFTSFDVVAKLRGITKQKKIGHTGTLDPAAEGVLPVCFGNATKLCEMFTDKKKTYEAVLLLGTSTDTLDTTGRVLDSREADFTEQEVRAAADSFRGTYGQIPPMYSALKVDGKRLYELAREGREVERRPREVTIYSIEILEISLPRVRFRAECSKGTYIRSLCQDIGDRLGCGGCMEHLVRSKSGPFTADQALTLEEIRKLQEAGRIGEAVISTEEILAEYAAYQVYPEYKKLIDNGNALSAEGVFKKDEPFALGDAAAAPAFSEDEKIRVYNAEGRFFALYSWREEKMLLCPDKIFPFGD